MFVSAYYRLLQQPTTVLRVLLFIRIDQTATVSQRLLSLRAWLLQRTTRTPTSGSSCLSDVDMPLFSVRRAVPLIDLRYCSFHLWYVQSTRLRLHHGRKTVINSGNRTSTYSMSSSCQQYIYSQENHARYQSRTLGLLIESVPIKCKLSLIHI